MRPVPPEATASAVSSVRLEIVEAPPTMPPVAFKSPAMVEEPVERKFVVVAEIVLMPANCEVDDAKMPPRAQSGVVVAAVDTPKFGRITNGDDSPKLQDCVVTWPLKSTVRHAPAPEMRLVIANDDEVASARMVLPATESVPLALSAPPTLSKLEMVVEPVTANVPVEVAPVVVRPPLNARVVEVALPMNG